jgi:electron transport complex protein RnfC
VQYYRYAKNEVWVLEKEKQRAEQARQRHQARMERLEREKQEREAKLRQKAPVRTESATVSAGLHSPLTPAPSPATGDGNPKS